jgi:hypothetical protein
MADTAKTCFLIVGLPRSGTSSIAQFLDHLGVYFGDPAHFLDTTKLKHNPIFYELQWINDFNDRVLGVWDYTYVQDVVPAEADFDRPEIKSLRQELREQFLLEFGDRAVVGVKDPRICFTFPLWRDVLTELGYTIKTVLALRDPSAIIKSNRALMLGRLHRWQRFYARHLLALRYFTRDITLFRFDYDLLMQDPLNYGPQRAAELGLAIPDPAQATRHLSRELYHHQPNDAGTGDSWVDRIDSEMRTGQLDPNEYLEFRSIASLFTGDLREQDRDIRQALSKKDSYIEAIETRNRESAQALSVKDQQIAALDVLINQSAEQLKMSQQLLADRDAQIQKLEDELARTQDELSRTQADLNQQQEDLVMRRGRVDSLVAELGALNAKHDALAQQLSELRARRLVRLMHTLDRLGGGHSEPAAP